jgi:hypothetical protein
VRTASIFSGHADDTPAAAQADEAEALAAAIVDGTADDSSSSPFEDFIDDIRTQSFDQRLASITARAPSGLAGRSFARQSSTKMPLGLDREASAALAANLQSALHLAGVSSCLEQRVGSFSGGANSSLGLSGKGSQGLKSVGVASLTRALSMLGSVAEQQDAETMEALIDEALAA